MPWCSPAALARLKRPPSERAWLMMKAKCVTSGFETFSSQNLSQFIHGA